MNGYKIREFQWSELHKCYIYGGVEINENDFNAIYEKAMKNNADLNVRVRVVGGSAEPQHAPPPATLQPVATITAAHEITVEEALAAVRRLAPQRLKQWGRPPTKVKKVA